MQTESGIYPATGGMRRVIGYHRTSYQPPSLNFMAHHFTREEFDTRLRAARASLATHELHGILLFAPESHYYLSGYDTFGFALFQCMVLPTDGDPHLLTRAPDLRQAQQTSILTDAQIHIWSDADGGDPHAALVQLLASLNLLGKNKRLGIETNTQGLTAFHGQKVHAALAGQAELVEASEAVSLLRRRKSKAELSYHRRAAELADDALDAALRATHSGAFEGDILAAMQGAIFAGGGDYAGNEFIIGSGAAALLCRYYSGRRHLSAQDQLTLEWAGVYRRYHAAMMRTLVVGKSSARQQKMQAATVEALAACEQAIRPGAPMGDVFAAHARVLDARGFAHARLNACGYSMGAKYTPTWMDLPVFYQNNPLLMEVDNVFFLHMIIMDSDAGLAMCYGHSVLVTESGAERLSRHSLDLLEC